jgi:hypothetical protein
LNTSMSVTGYTGRRRQPGQVNIETGKADRDLTRFGQLPASPELPGVSPADPKPNPSPHSGWLGSINSTPPPGEIPAATAYRPEEYNDIQPRQEFAPSLEIPAEFNLAINGKKLAGTLCLVELLNNREYVFGRADSSQTNDPKELRVVVKSLQRVSRHHFKIAAHDGRYWISDLSSKFGTILNAVRLTPYVEHELMPGDQIAMAEYPALEFKGPIRKST